MQIARALQVSGWSTRVVTGIPNYPHGQVFPGYQAYRTTYESVDGLHVKRCPVYPSHDRSAVRRAGNYLSFAASAGLFAAHTLASADAVVVYSSPETAAIPAAVTKGTAGTPFVLIVQDLWPETVMETGFLQSGISRTVAGAVLRGMDAMVCRSASRILVISPGMRDRLVARGVPESRIRIMHNWANEGLAKPMSRSGNLRRRIGAGDEDVILLYGGNHGSAQGLDAWLTALGRTQDLTRVHAVFVGDGVDKHELERRAASERLERLHFLDPVDSSDFAAMAADADAQIIALAAQPLFEITIPGKVQACLSQAACVLASVAGDAAELLLKAQAGFVAKPEDPADIERIIREAEQAGPERFREMGAAGREFYSAHLSRERGSAILSEAVRESIEESDRRSRS